MRIVDAHHHLWNLDPVDPGIGYKWLRQTGVMRPFGDPAPIQRDYLIAELKAETTRAELIGSVHIQCDGTLETPEEETRWLQSVADKEGMPNALIALVDFSKPNAEQVLTAHRKHANFRGVRQIIARLEGRPDLSFVPTDLLQNDLWRQQFPLLADFDASFDLQLYPEQMAEAAAFLADHPSIPVVVDHLGSPHDQSVEGLAKWETALSHLAALPHVCIKLSGMGMYDRNWSAASVKPLYETMMDLFGPSRIMFGSNYPVDKLFATYDDVLDQVSLLTADLSEPEKAAIFEGTARKFYRI